MLPFLKNKQEGAMSEPVEIIERESDEGPDSFDMLDAVVEDMHIVTGKQIGRAHV